MDWMFYVSVVALFMAVFFAIGMLSRDHSVVDIGWGCGFIVLGWQGFLEFPAAGSHALLVNGMVTLWGLRLAWHLVARKTKEQTEDWRYRQWRKSWGALVNVRAFFQVYLLQGALMLVVALPVLLVNAEEHRPLGLVAFLGLGVWLLGLVLEAVADRQLAAFKANPDASGVMTSGLWRYSRHPNYFGEALLWWGIGLTAYGGTGDWRVFIGSATITFLVRFVSGVPMLEQKYMKRPAFQEYAKHTSIFVPFPEDTFSL